MREFDCPYCRSEIALDFWHCCPNHLGLPDVDCSNCDKKSFFPLTTKLTAYLVGASSMLAVLVVFTAFFPFTTYLRALFGLSFGGFAYAYAAACVCYFSPPLVRTFTSIRRTSDSP